MKIFTDEISERYRKYIIQLKLPAKRSMYLLWGTDTGNEDSDYLMLDPANRLLGFSTIKALLHYVKTTKHALTDEPATKEWVSAYKANRAYVSYDIELLIGLMEVSDKRPENYTKAAAVELTDFCHLFSDYAYQLNQQEWVRLYQDKDLHVFIDWVHARYLWKPDAAYLAALTDQLKHIDFEKIKTKVRKMYHYLMQNLVVISNTDC